MNAVALPVPGSETIQAHAADVATTPIATTALYISEDFETRETDQPERLTRDVTVNGVAYRTLDPPYYAWLRHRMTRAKEAYVAGDMTAERFEELREAFNGVHAWAIQRFAEHDLLRALDRLRPKHYDGPKAPRWSRGVVATGADTGRSVVHRGVCAKVVSPRAVAQVDAIRDQAFALGWSHASLYATHGRFAFPCGQDYGLVCFLGVEDRIANVTHEYVEILREGKREGLKFYRPNETAVRDEKISGT